MTLKKISLKKSATAVTLALATTFTLAACGDDESAGGDQAASSNENGDGGNAEGVNNSFESVLDKEANPEAMLADGVSIPADAKLYKTSGIGPSALNENAEEGTPMAYVDSALLVDGELPDGMTVTEAQGLGVLKKIRELLQAQGLDVQNVATMRVFLQGENGEAPDVDGWNRAYRQYFANTDLRTG